jgi:hypothetical protein
MNRLLANAAARYVYGQPGCGWARASGPARAVAIWSATVAPSCKRSVRNLAIALVQVQVQGGLDPCRRCIVGSGHLLWTMQIRSAARIIFVGGFVVHVAG